DIPRARLFASNRATGPQYAVLHPIASEPAKTWPPHRLLAIAAKLGMQPIFIGGPREELIDLHGHRHATRPQLAENPPHLAASTLVMACVGAAHAMMAFLIGPIFDYVLNPAPPDSPVLLFTIPVAKRAVYLNQLIPPGIHDIWSMVAFGIVSVFLVKGVCD